MTASGSILAIQAESELQSWQTVAKGQLWLCPCLYRCPLSAQHAHLHMCLQLRREEKLAKAGKYGSKVAAKQRRSLHKQQHPQPLGEFYDTFKLPQEGGS